MRAPVRAPEPAVAAALKYYSPAVHAAAFVLPTFAEDAVAAVRRPTLPSMCRSVAPPVLSRSSLALAALGAVVGAVGVAAMGIGRPR